MVIDGVVEGLVGRVKVEDVFGMKMFFDFDCEFCMLIEGGENIMVFVFDVEIIYCVVKI